MSNLYLIRGIPGAGKTTFVKSLVRMLNGNGTFYEADQFPGLYQDGNFQGGLLREAHRWCLENALNALETHPCVFVSNTFTRRWEIQPYHDGAIRNGHMVFVLIAEGNHPNEHNVPDEKVSVMIDRWEAWAP